MSWALFCLFFGYLGDKAGSAGDIFNWFRSKTLQQRCSMEPKDWMRRGLCCGKFYKGNCWEIDALQVSSGFLIGKRLPKTTGSWRVLALVCVSFLSEIGTLDVIGAARRSPRKHPWGVLDDGSISGFLGEDPAMAPFF